MIFGQFLNSTLENIEIVVECSPQNEALDHTIVLTLDGARYQILEDRYPNPSIWLIDDETPIVVGDFHDDGASFFFEAAIPEFLSLPSRIVSISEFQDEFEFVGCEILLASGSGFSILTHPEDILLKEAGAVWRWCQEWVIPPMSKLTVTNTNTT